MDRRTYRIEAMKFLYTLEMGSEYNREDIDNEVYEAVSELIENTDDIEKILNDSMTGWTLKRLNIVDKCILKFAVYEMKYKEIPPQIAINEAIEITKIYSDIDGKQSRFNNKVLDKAKELCKK